MFKSTQVHNFTSIHRMKFKVNQSVRSQWSLRYRLQRNATPLQSWQQPAEFHNAFKNLRAEWSISLILSRCLSQTHYSQRAERNARALGKTSVSSTSMTFYSPLSHHTQVLGVQSATSQFILPLCRAWASALSAGSVWSCMYRVFVIKHRWAPVANSARAQSARSGETCFLFILLTWSINIAQQMGPRL